MQPTTGTLTFLFTDIEGSTARWEAQREAMAGALVRHDALLRETIEGRGGTVFKTVGDAFCAVFADAEAALGAAMDAQRALAAEAWSAFGPEFADLRVRMGLHTGKADERDGDYFGPALNRTARLMSAGHGGQVLLSRAAEEQLADRLPPGSRLRDLGEHRLKDLRHSERIYQLVVEGLRDVVKAPQTAEALDARDRIIVSDPNAAEGAEDEGAQAVVVQRDVPETLAAILAVIRGDERSLVLTVPQVIAAARHRPADLTAYRLGRIAEWSQPRYRLDGRFVALTLLIDQGEDATGGRWAAKERAYDDLGALLANTPDPAVVVLGPPGAGKSTLLRRLELDAAIAGLRGEEAKGGSAGGAGGAGRRANGGVDTGPASRGRTPPAGRPDRVPPGSDRGMEPAALPAGRSFRRPDAAHRPGRGRGAGTLGGQGRALRGPGRALGRHERPGGRRAGAAGGREIDAATPAGVGCGHRRPARRSGSRGRSCRADHLLHPAVHLRPGRARAGTARSREVARRRLAVALPRPARLGRPARR
ncbi:MAG: adenylate/guanylate cyclase domain-containing protein, partial [Anaerolineae bacterium]